MKIDHQIEAARSQAVRQQQVVREPAPSMSRWCQQNLIDVMIVGHHGRGQRLDQIGDACVGESRLTA